jgi:hypothetical protein
MKNEGVKHNKTSKFAGHGSSIQRSGLFDSVDGFSLDSRKKLGASRDIVNEADNLARSPHL